MEINNKIDILKDSLVRATQGILQIKSVESEGKPGSPFGEGVNKALEYALNLSRELGLTAVNLDGYVGYAEYGIGEEYIAVLGHLDVVPEGEGWQHNPYGAEIHEGKIYARGAMDDKGPMMSALYGLKAIQEQGIVLSKRIRIIFGTNEETGSKEIAYYANHERPPVAGFTPDAEYPIIYAEKGLTVFDIVKDLKPSFTKNHKIKYIRGGQRANMVPDYCEAGIHTSDKAAMNTMIDSYASSFGYEMKVEELEGMLIVKSFGVAAHGSVPELGKNAIAQLFEVLGKLPFDASDVFDFITFYNNHISFDTYGGLFGVALEDEISGKLSFNVGTVTMDETQIKLELNLRYPVTFALEDMMRPFEGRIRGTGIRIENLVHQPPLYVPKDSFLIKTLQQVYAEQTGQEARLLAIGGGTYAKEMPNIVAFGPIFPGKPDLDHQANEYIEIEDLVLNAKIYAHAMVALAK